MDKSFAFDKKKKKKSECLIHMCSNLFFNAEKCKKYIKWESKKEDFESNKQNRLIVLPISDKDLKKDRLCIKWKDETVKY